MNTEKEKEHLPRYGTVKITLEQRKTLKQLAVLLEISQTNLVSDYIAHLAKKHRHKLQVFK